MYFCPTGGFNRRGGMGRGGRGGRYVLLSGTALVILSWSMDP